MPLRDKMMPVRDKNGKYKYSFVGRVRYNWKTLGLVKANESEIDLALEAPTTCL